MSKYLEFKEIPFKGKTKRFEVLSKTSFEECPECLKNQHYTCDCIGKIKPGCKTCNQTGKIPIVLGRIQWYSQWRQYVLMPGYPTIWNRDCMNDIIFFITNLMKDRKIVLMKEKS